MNAQAELNFDIAEPDVKTLNDIVRVLMRDGKWWAPFELVDEIWRTRSVRISDSTLSARLRDLRKAQYGSHVIAIRKRKGTRYFEYKMES